MGKTKTALIGETKLEEPKKESSPVVEKPSRVKRHKARVKSKRYLKQRAKIDQNKLYSLPEAIKLAKETNIAKFKASVEMHLVVKKTGFSTSVSLPHSLGSEKKIEIASDKTVKKLEGGKIDFDVLLATADFMPKLVPFARILGPKGLMPNPKNGTLIKDASAAKKFDTNKLNLKTEKEAPLIHTTIGKINMGDTELIENAKAIIDAINARQILKCFISTSMGPSVKVAVE